MNIPGSRSATFDAAGRKSIRAVIVCALLWTGRLELLEAGTNVWTSQGPPGDPVLAVAIDPLTRGTLYAVSGYSGIFKSSDGGEAWQATNSGLEGFFLDDVAFASASSPVLYVAAYLGASGLYRSDDGGVSWSPIGPDTPPGVRSLAVDPASPTTLYASILFRAFLTKTVDGGATWDIIAAFPDEIMDVAVDPREPSTVYAAAFRATPSGGVLWKSLDGGQTWNTITDGLFDPFTGRRYDVLRAVIDPVHSSIVYITTSGGGFKSADGGETWTPTARAVMAVHPETTTTVYAGSRGDGVFKSTDGGETWAAMNPGLSDRMVNHVVVDPRTPERIYAATDSGVFVIQVDDADGPDVALAFPGAGATVGSTINVSADAADRLEVAGVQFLLDGEPLGPEDTSAPYEVPWDTRTVAEGSHALAARARDIVANHRTSDTITVTVANGSAPTRAMRRFEEGAAALAPQGAWTAAGSGDFGVIFSGDLAAWSETARASATFTFRGTGVRWLGFACERCGVAEVLIDGARVATVDAYSATRPASSQVMYTGPHLPMGEHTLTIEVSGTANTASAGSLVAVDAIESLMDGMGKPARGAQSSPGRLKKAQ